MSEVEVETFFKPAKQEKRRRSWNSTLPAATKRVNQRTKKARRDDKTFKEGRRGARCDRCGRSCRPDASHRAPRSLRPDLRGSAANRDDLCRTCHEDIPDDREQAIADGWLDPETSEAANSDPMDKVIRQLNEP